MPLIPEIKWPTVNAGQGGPKATIEVQTSTEASTEQSPAENTPGTWNKFSKHSSHLWTSAQKFTNLVWTPTRNEEPPPAPTPERNHLIRVKVPITKR